MISLYSLIHNLRREASEKEGNAKIIGVSAASESKKGTSVLRGDWSILIDSALYVTAEFNPDSLQIKKLKLEVGDLTDRRMDSGELDALVRFTSIPDLLNIMAEDTSKEKTSIVFNLEMGGFPKVRGYHVEVVPFVTQTGERTYHSECFHPVTDMFGLPGYKRKTLRGIKFGSIPMGNVSEAVSYLLQRNLKTYVASEGEVERVTRNFYAQIGVLSGDYFLNRFALEAKAPKWGSLDRKTIDRMETLVSSYRNINVRTKTPILASQVTAKQDRPAPNYLDSFLNCAHNCMISR